MALDGLEPIPDRDEWDSFDDEPELLAVERAAPVAVPHLVRTSGRWGTRPKTEEKKREFTPEEQRRLRDKGEILTPAGVLRVRREPLKTTGAACPACSQMKVKARAAEMGGGRWCYGCGLDVAPRMRAT